MRKRQIVESPDRVIAGSPDNADSRASHEQISVNNLT
jgi:hypothetical protein